MKHTPLTEKQAKAQVRLCLFQSVYGLYWLVMGIVDKSWVYLIIGFVFLAFELGLLFYTLWVVITVGFLIAFGLAWALS
jgi:hypothetical protein